MLLELLDHAIEIGISGTKAPCEPVPAALGNPLAVSDNLELTGLIRHSDGFNVEALPVFGYSLYRFRYCRCFPLKRYHWYHQHSGNSAIPAKRMAEPYAGPFYELARSAV